MNLWTLIWIGGSLSKLCQIISNHMWAANCSLNFTKIFWSYPPDSQYIENTTESFQRFNFFLDFACWQSWPYFEKRERYRPKKQGDSCMASFCLYYLPWKIINMTFSQLLKKAASQKWPTMYKYEQVSGRATKQGHIHIHVYGNFVVVLQESRCVHLGISKQLCQCEFPNTRKSNNSNFLSDGNIFP